MGIIYLLYNKEGFGYVGKTNKLRDRIRQHRFSNQNTKSKLLGEFEYMVIEDFENEDDLDSAERFYYDLYKSLYGDKLVNKKKPIQTKEDKKAYATQYNQQHRGERNQQRIKKYECECGSIICYGEKTPHFKSQKHLNYIQNTSV